MQTNIFHARPRFLFSLGLTLLGVLAFKFFSFADALSTLEKFLILYNVFQWTYLFCLLYLVFNASVRHIKKSAIIEDESANFVLITSTTSSIITLVTIALELVSAKDTHGIAKSIHLILPAVTLVGVWALLPTMFAIHYAHLYYLNENEDKRPMRFPDVSLTPDYLDFLYFSVTIAVASQTADVSVTSKRGRRFVLLQSILAFLFNTSVLALGINVAASLLN
jgi:uncharacterized membrane protein